MCCMVSIGTLVVRRQIDPGCNSSCKTGLVGFRQSRDPHVYAKGMIRRRCREIRPSIVLQSRADPTQYPSLHMNRFAVVWQGAR